MRDKFQEALAIYDFVAENLLHDMTLDERAEMEKILFELVKYNKYLVAFYPNNVDFLVNEYRLQQLLKVVNHP